MVTNNEEIYDKYNKAVFPGWQGGPLMHVIAAKARRLWRGGATVVLEYAHAVVENAAALGEGLVEGAACASFPAAPTITCASSTSRPRASPARRPKSCLEPLGITTNKNAIPTIHSRLPSRAACAWEAPRLPRVALTLTRPAASAASSHAPSSIVMTDRPRGSRARSA